MNVVCFECKKKRRMKGDGDEDCQSSKKGEGRRRRTDDREITLRYIAVEEQYLFWKMVVKEISKPHTEKR